MIPQLTVHNATITTATIEIRTLTIGTRQVTQNIFRQLPEHPVINHAGNVDGTPWGTVNYHPDRCEDTKEHIHVVWQCGDELRRSHVRCPLNAYLEHRLAPQYAIALIAEGASRFDRDSPISVYRSPAGGGAVARFNLLGVSFRAAIPVEFMRAWEPNGDPAWLREQAREAYGEDLLPSRDIAQQLPVEAYKASWRTLAQLPQLFIGR